MHASRLTLERASNDRRFAGAGFTDEERNPSPARRCRSPGFAALRDARSSAPGTSGSVSDRRAVHAAQKRSDTSANPNLQELQTPGNRDRDDRDTHDRCRHDHDSPAFQMAQFPCREHCGNHRQDRERQAERDVVIGLERRIAILEERSRGHTNHQASEDADQIDQGACWG